MITRYLACASALFAIVTLGAACKSDGGGIDAEFITIAQTSPMEGADDVVVGTRVGFQVSDGAQIDPATLNAQTFFLTDEDGNAIPGTYAVGGDDNDPTVAVMVLDEPLDVITKYTATVTTGLVASGVSLEENFEWDFTTIDSEWGESEWLESIGTGVSDGPQVAVNPQLDAFAVWEYEEPEGTSVWANRYTRTEVWGTPMPLEPGVFGSSNPAVAADGEGNAFAVWERRRAEGVPRDNIWSSRYDPAAGWSEPELLQTGTTVPDGRIPSIAADTSGNAIAVWLERNPNTSEEVATANIYTVGAGWGSPERIDAPSEMLVGLNAGNNLAVEVDATGNAIALWSRPGVEGDVLWSNRYTAGMGWGAAEEVKSDPATDATSNQLSVGANGDALAVWIQNEGARNDIWGARYSSGSWAAPERIDTHDGNDKSAPDVAVNGLGVAHVVWSQVEPYPDPELLDDDIANIYAREYSPETGWAAPELIEPPRTDADGNLDPNEDGDATSPRVSTNADGNTFVVWRQIWQDWGSIWSNRRDPGNEWNGAELIEDLPRAARSAQIAVDDDRHAHAVWLHNLDNGASWVRTNRFE